MGIISRCFCDPFKLTYVSAIVTGIEGVVFAVLNIVLICMYTCDMSPPSNVALGFDKFWAFYFYDRQRCDDKGVVSPWWTNYTYPLGPNERSLTTPYDNFLYQCIFLVLHGAWIVTAIILLYGNAKKKWGYYIPWLLVSTTLLVMDVTISAFCIQDLVTVTDTGGYQSAMFWVLVLYFRIFIICFINISQMASAFNAFCKCRHKRAKQEHQKRKMAKAHSEEVRRVEAATEARVRAQMAEQQVAQEMQTRPKIPPPVPKKPAAPTELRPFSYLNPAYRPNDPTDVEGMRAHPLRAPDIPAKPLHIPSLQGPYFPDDTYTRTRDLEGLPRRYDSVRNFRTQDRHLALRRFSSTRGLPSLPAHSPHMPAPDYDMTLRPRPFANNQSEYKRHGSWMSFNDGKCTSPSLPVTHAPSKGETNHSLPYTNTLAAPTHPSPPTVTQHPYRHTSLPNIIPPPTHTRPSPLFYTQTPNRTHLQIYEDEDSLSLQGEQGDKLIFGGMFVPLHCRRLTYYIANSFLKAEGREREEFLDRFWDDQWRSMREGRANSPQRQCSEGTNGTLLHTKKFTTNAIQKEKESHTWKTITHSKDLSSVPTNLNKVGRNTCHNNNNYTPDLSRILGNEASFKSVPEAPNRRTVPPRRTHKHSRRKLSETYINVSLKESRNPASQCPPRPPSVASEDLLPSHPAFPITFRSGCGLHAH